MGVVTPCGTEPVRYSIGVHLRGNQPSLVRSCRLQTQTQLGRIVAST
jgi:hypothetical protein